MSQLEKKQIIMDALSRYLRWISEGRPEKQYYYDSYHDSINKIGDNKYSFYIQLSDSPEGDTWWNGEFETLNSNTDVKILSESYSRH
jgi:hypothetical protein